MGLLKFNLNDNEAKLISYTKKKPSLKNQLITGIKNALGMKNKELVQEKTQQDVFTTLHSTPQSNDMTHPY